MFGLSMMEVGVIGMIALIVVGPERLPRLARTIGALVGKAQRYVASVKAEVNRSIELEDLQKLKASVTDAAQSVQQSMNEVTSDLSSAWPGNEAASLADLQNSDALTSSPQYQRPAKNWRLKRGATPSWYKAHQGVRRQVQSGAARVARFRPKSGR